MDFRLSKKSGHFLILAILFGTLVLSSLSASAQSTHQSNSKKEVLLAAPTVANGSFESSSLGTGKTSLSGWIVTDGKVDVLDIAVDAAPDPDITIVASDGNKFLNLANATIGQSVSGFTIGETYVLRIDYLSNTNDQALNHAKVLIDGVERRQGLFGFDPVGIHSKEDRDWISCNGFQFTPTSTTVNFEIESEDLGANGLLIDNIRFLEGAQPQPPLNLLTVQDSWVSLENGDFQELPTSPLINSENNGPANNPHICGGGIPGWRVTRENVDMVNGFGDKSTGDWITDTGGHGPGGLAHAIGGLVPNASYTLEFEAAMHIYWGAGPMRSGFVSNGVYIKEIVRTSSQGVDDGPYPKEQIDLTSDADGKITFELYSLHTDLGGNIAYDNFRIIKKQDPPQIINPGDQSSNDQDEIMLTIVATDSDEDDLAFSATGLPTGLSINEDSGVISGTISAAGTYNAEVTVSDGGRTDSAEFEWVVNALPVLSLISDQFNHTGESVSLAVVASDSDSSMLDYSAAGLPTGLSINQDNGEVSGIPTAGGEYTVTVTVADNNGGEDSQSFTWTINNIPVVTSPGAQSTKKDSVVDLLINASDPDEDSISFVATGLPSGLAINLDTGQISGTVTTVDMFSVTITVTDSFGGKKSITFNWEVFAETPTTGEGDELIFLPLVIR